MIPKGVDVDSLNSGSLYYLITYEPLCEQAIGITKEEAINNFHEKIGLKTVCKIVFEFSENGALLFFGNISGIRVETNIREECFKICHGDNILFRVNISEGIQSAKNQAIKQCKKLWSQQK